MSESKNELENSEDVNSIQDETVIESLMISVTLKTQRYDEKEVQQLVDNAIEQWKALKESPEKSRTKTIKRISDLNSLGQTKKCKFIAHIQSFKDGLSFQLDSGKRVFYCEATLSDNDSVIDTVVITDPELAGTLRDLYRCAKVGLFTGIPVDIAQSPRCAKRRFLILRFNLVTGVWQSLLPTKKELKIIQKLLRKIENGDVVSFLVRQVVAISGLKGFDDWKLLQTCCRQAILVCLSTGRLQRGPAKLHILLIGAPGLGKKLITLILKILSPVFREAHAFKATPAGLAGGMSFLKDGTRKTDPGLSVQAHEGVLDIQDAHSLKKTTLQEVYGLFSMVMEDGEIHDSTIAKAKYEACTSVVLDINRQEDLFGGKWSKLTLSESLHDIPSNLLTRFDFIPELPRDPERSHSIACQILESSDEAQNNEELLSPRILQLIVAYLREQYPAITLPTEVRQYASQRLKEFLSENKEVFQERAELNDYLARTAVSIQKVISALARGNMRSEANIQDADRAFSLIKPKFDFLKAYSQDLNTESLKKPKIPGGEEASAWIVQNFGGTSVKFSQVKEAFVSEYGIPNHRAGSESFDRSIYRYLEKCGRKIGNGLYEIDGPPEDDDL